MLVRPGQLYVSMFPFGLPETIWLKEISHTTSDSSLSVSDPLSGAFVRPLPPVDFDEGIPESECCH